MKKNSLVSNKCPKCLEGKVFNSFFFINKVCPNCGLKFEKEEGYFFGPMIISYFITLLLATPILLLMTFKYETEFSQAMLAVSGLVLLVGPVLYRYSKLIWLHLESGFDQKMQAEQERAKKLSNRN